MPCRSARRRVTAHALARPGEEGLALLRIAHEDVQDLVRVAVRHRVDRGVEKGGQVLDASLSGRPNAGIFFSGRPTLRNAPSCLPPSSLCTRSERVRSGPIWPPRAFEPWQKPHLVTSTCLPRSTAGGLVLGLSSSMSLGGRAAAGGVTAGLGRGGWRRVLSGDGGGGQQDQRRGQQVRQTQSHLQGSMSQGFVTKK